MSDLKEKELETTDNNENTAPAPKKGINKYKRVLIFAGVFILAGVLVYLAFVNTLPELWAAFSKGDEAALEAFLEENKNGVGILYLALLQIVQVISVFIPTLPIQIAGGMVYGALRGYVVCHLSYTFANFCVMAAVRKFSGLNELLGNSSRGKVQKALNFINKGDPFVTVLILCMIPIIPNGLIPYAASQMDIRIRSYTLATFLGSLFPSIAMAMAGRYIMTGNYIIAGAWLLADGIMVLLLYIFRNKVSEVLTAARRKAMEKRKHE